MHPFATCESFSYDSWISNEFYLLMIRLMLQLVKQGVYFVRFCFTSLYVIFLHSWDPLLLQHTLHAPCVLLLLHRAISTDRHQSVQQAHQKFRLFLRNAFLPHPHLQNLKRLVVFCPLVMVSPVCTAWRMCKPKKWWSFLLDWRCSDAVMYFKWVTVREITFSNPC